MDYKIKLDFFQGPLDLLYKLIKKRKIEISEVSLASVTEQYLDYIRNLDSFNLELTSDFLIIAADLIELKTRTLLPEYDEDTEESDYNNSLLDRLEEYNYFKELSNKLIDLEYRAAHIFSHPVTDLNEFDEDIKLEIKIKLEEFAKIYTEAIKSKKIATPESLSFIINEDEISIITRIDIIKKTVEVEKRTRFTKLLSAGMNKLEIILIFLAMLELMRTGFLKVSQNDMFSDIIIEKN